jgi:23S rRNA (cytosine1962-C5)-methyltransferase
VTLLPIFTTFPAAWIRYEDDVLLCVEKPWGLSTHAAEESRSDDLASWLRAHYEQQAKPNYLGIHQRLDKDTSGLVLFARSKSANASLAAQFEGRSVRKTYLAVVEGRIPDRGKLDHRMGHGDGKRRSARPLSSTPRRDDREAHATFEVLERRGRRSLVRLVPSTGRTHQLRAQLAAIAAPIVGDTLYGGALHRRLLLHADGLALDHPTTGAALTFSSPCPDELRRALDTMPKAPKNLTLELQLAAARRVGIAAPGVTEALRWVNGEVDGLTDVTVDLYGAFAVLSLYRPFVESELAETANAMLELGVRGLYLKRRPKHASRVGETRQDAIAPPLPIAGEPAPDPMLIHEGGVPYEVRLGDGLSTGIFLDQRENRARVAALAKDKSVLNLFAYTGAFSVAAVRGGASRTMTVDVSPASIAWAQRNLARVGADPARHEVSVSDVFEFLVKERARTRRWDLVVLDPPSFSTTKRSVFSAESEFVRLATMSMSVLRPGGSILACTNHRGISRAKFRRFLHEAARTAHVHVAQMKDLPDPVDFPAPPGGECHLKTLLVTTS